MPQIQTLSLFPELFDAFSQHGLMRRAIEDKVLSFSSTHLRDFAINTQGQVDDTPYGGGSGMVLRPEPAFGAIRAAKERDPSARVVLMSPRGERFDQKMAKEFAQAAAEKDEGLIFLCNRYEGVDQRVVDELVDIELSVGDYVLMGGEVAAMSVIEAITRLLPGVLGNPESLEEESFSDYTLEYPQYTKPQNYEGLEAPEILLSGHHGQVTEWRKEKALETTLERRPDLLRDGPNKSSLYGVVLIHYPVVNKEGDTVISSLTNLDLHDISRSVTTYGIERLYVVHPVKALRQLAHKIYDHWETGYGSTYNPNRSEALSRLSIVCDFEDVILDVEEKTKSLPKLIVTSAKDAPGVLSFEKLRAMLHTDETPHLLLLGTGWGLGDEILERATCRLEPIKGPTDYNHLSVRAAAAIMFDRLLG